MKSFVAAKKFARRHKKLLWWGGGGIVAATLLYAVTRPKKKPTLAELIMSVPESAKVSYLSTIKGMTEFQNVTTRLTNMLHTMEYGAPVVVDEATFRRLYTHQGTHVINLVIGAFYNKNGLTFDELQNHSHCQTLAAQVVGLGNDWEGRFYNQVYRGAPVVANGATYAGVPIDPQTNPGGFELAVRSAIEANIRTALKNGDLGGSLTSLGQMLGPTFAALFGGSLPNVSGQYIFDLSSPWTRDVLAQFARDLAAKNGTPLPTAPAPMLTMMHASVGASMVAKIIEMFESHNTDEKKGVVNPCIQELTPELVLGMFMAVLAVFLTVASLGAAGAFGPVISAISFAYKLQDSIRGLAALSK